MKRVFSPGELFKGDKKITLAIIAGAALMLLLAFGGLGGGTNDSGGVFDMKSRAAYEAELEKRLASILSEIEDVGELRVMVTLDTSEQTEYGKNKDMLLSVKMPQARGVIVVCGGGDSAVVREKVVSAVSGVLGISSARVSVVR